MVPNQVQDGCYAWVVCGASFLLMVMQGVLLFCTGIFYIILKENLEAGDSEIALVTSLALGFNTMACLFVGMLTERFGQRNLAILGSLLAVVGSVSSSLATQAFHLYITYSLMVGIGTGMVWNSSVSILPRYFDKYKATAAGITLCGLGVGGFVFPPIIKVLIDTYGWRGTFVMIGGIYAHGVILGSLFAPIETPQKKFRDAINRAIIDVKETTVDELDFNFLLTRNGDDSQDTIQQKEENGTFSRIAITFHVPITVDSVPFEKVAVGLGLVSFSNFPGMVIGPPLAAWLHGLSHNYASSFYLSGVLYIVAGAVMIPAVWRSLRGRRLQQEEIVEVSA